MGGVTSAEQSFLQRLTMKEKTWVAMKQDFENDVQALEHEVLRVTKQLHAATEAVKQREAALTQRFEAHRRLMTELEKARRAVTHVMTQVESAARWTEDGERPKGE